LYKLLSMDSRPFIKLYIENIISLTRLTPKSRNVLFGIVHYLEVDNTIDLSSHRRKLVLQALNMTKQTFSNGLVELKSSGILTEIGTNYYAVDPMYLTRPE